MPPTTTRRKETGRMKDYNPNPSFGLFLCRVLTLAAAAWILLAIITHVIMNLIQYLNQ